jgi:geranylgeranyl reductase family protein
VRNHSDWDVVVIGAGPAGLAAAYAAATAGARTVVIERGKLPRYKTCGGGLIGTSLSALPPDFSVPERDRIDAATFSLDGRRQFTRRARHRPLLSMVLRDEFDHALARAAQQVGVSVIEQATVRGVHQDSDGAAYARLADGSHVRGGVLVGADGSSGFTARHVGVDYVQTDVGLEVEVPTPVSRKADWNGRILLDWGPVPGSYGWVFPKDDRLTVGVIASRSAGDATRRYLKDFLDRLDLSGVTPLQDSGHLTRCRSEHSPLRAGRVLVAGDAAGLLEPWTREGISFALRSGALAGAAAADAAGAERSADVDARLDGYQASVARELEPEMRAGRRLYAAFSSRPALFHAAVATPMGWSSFMDICRGEANVAGAARRLPVRLALAALRA